MKIIAISLLLFLTVGTVDVFAQVNGTATNSTAPVEEIADITNPQILLSATNHLQGDMLKITGSNLEPNKTVEMTMYHPDNTKFGIFKATTTNVGEFQLLVEMVQTSKQGNYTITTSIGDATLTNHFVYSGAHNLSFGETTQIIEQEPAPSTTAPPATQTTSSSSSSSGSSYTAPTTTNADLKGILELLRTIIQANNAILINIESMLASMG